MTTFMWLMTIAEKDPEKAIRILSDLSEYVIPKLARTDLTSSDEKIGRASCRERVSFGV